jgi:hypothetical protein
MDGMDAFVPLLATLIPPEKQTFCWRTYLLYFTVFGAGNERSTLDSDGDEEAIL